MGLGIILNEASEKEMKYPHSRVSMCVVVCVCVCVCVCAFVFVCLCACFCVSIVMSTGLHPTRTEE